MSEKTKVTESGTSKPISKVEKVEVKKTAKAIQSKAKAKVVKTAKVEKVEKKAKVEKVVKVKREVGQGSWVQHENGDIEIYAPMCKCQNEAQYLLRRKDGSRYFYSNGPICEGNRQKRNRAKRLAQVALVEKIDLGNGPTKALQDIGLNKVVDLVQFDGEFEDIKGIGKASANKIRLFLETFQVA